MYRVRVFQDDVGRVGLPFVGEGAPPEFADSAAQESIECAHLVRSCGGRRHAASDRDESLVHRDAVDREKFVSDADVGREASRDPDSAVHDRHVERDVS